MNIEQALRTELSSIIGLSTKVFPLTPPQGTQVPFLVYTLNSVERERNLQTGFDGLVSKQFQLDIFHSSYPNLKSLMALVIAKIKTFIGREIGTSGPYIQDAEIINELELYENEVSLYHGIIEITLYCDEN